jgi:predicted HAD superfamily Cof-like phosphohydrolase
MEFFYNIFKELKLWFKQFYFMNEPFALTSVAQFHHLGNQPVLDNPQIPPEDRVKLRINVIQEELDELSYALATGDVVEMADALADLQYVLSGTILECGVGNKFKELFDEVHRSNMTKACKTMEEAVQTQDSYTNKGTECYIKERDGLFVVYRTSDNKMLKSVNYSPTNLKKILYEQD